MRKVAAVDLWEISIVTFPLLAGARVRAVKGVRFSGPPYAAARIVAAPKPTPARSRAELDWRALFARTARSPDESRRVGKGAPLRAVPTTADLEARGTRLARLHDAVRTILRNDWDPIGIRDVPQAGDEYGGYAPTIARMVLAGKSVTQLSAYLLKIETGAMGLTGDRDRTCVVAEKLRALPQP